MKNLYIADGDVLPRSSRINPALTIYARGLHRGAKRNIRIYLDSGWPSDNYEVTRNMAVLLDRKGYATNNELLYFAFPQARHNERSWAMRTHIPFQFFFERGFKVSEC